MKKLAFLFAFSCFALLSKAQVIYDETFDYLGSSLTTESSWTNTLAANGAAIGTIGNLSSDPLSYGDANGMYALSGLGKLVTSDYTSGGTDFKVVKTIPAKSSGVIYLSLLFKPGVAQNQANSEIMGLSIAGSNGPKVLIGKGVSTVTNFRFATTRASSSSVDYKFAATEYSDINQTFLLVVKYDWTAKTASLFVNPVIGSASEPTPDVIDNTSAKDVAAAIDGIRFRTNGSSAAKFQVSGVRVSGSWAAAVGKQVAELPSPVASAATNVSNSSFTANWSPVANALGYSVAIYSNSVLVKTISVDGQSASSVSVTGLSSNLTYTYKVTAIADKLTFANSQLGNASPDVTTLGLSVPSISAASAISTSGFTVNWGAVSGATGYDVVLTLNTSLVKTITVGAGATSAPIADLQMGTGYKVHVVAKGNGSTILDSTPSETIICTTESTAVASILTDFGVAAIWGAPVPSPSTNLPLNGNYPTWKVNGFSFEKALFYAGTNEGPYGELHSNVISFDKLLTAAVVFPAVSTVGQIEFHVFSGSDAKSIALEELGVDGVTWTPVGASPYTTTKVESVVVENISRSTPTVFRLRNNATSSMNVSQIIVRPTLPSSTALTSPIIGAATNIIPGGFTANWTPVDNASGYFVSVFNYSKALYKNFSVTGQSVNSLNVSGLDSASVCSYKVVAVGDGVTHTNSLLSAASPTFKLEADPAGINSAVVSRYINVVGKTIFASEVGNFEIYTIQGAKIYNLQDVRFVNTNLAKGIYIVRFTNSSGLPLTQKVIIR
ncbi:MAG: hypothetical protein ACOYOT_07005 [Bacteroidales bacterium]